MENPEGVASQQWGGGCKVKAGETDVQWTQDKLRQSRSGEGKGEKDVAGQWDEKWKETATWASDHKATRHPHHPLQNLLKSHPWLSAPPSL